MVPGWGCQLISLQRTESEILCGQGGETLRNGSVFLRRGRSRNEGQVIPSLSFQESNQGFVISRPGCPDPRQGIPTCGK